MAANGWGKFISNSWIRVTVLSCRFEAGCKRITVACVGAGTALLSFSSWATEGGLGRQTLVPNIVPDADMVAPQPISAVNLTQIYFDRSINGDRDEPIVDKTWLGLDGKIPFDLYVTPIVTAITFLKPPISL